MNFSSLETTRQSRRYGMVAQAVCAISVMVLSSGCASKDSGTASQSYKGVINIEGVRFGIPEESVKTAILTFVADPNVAQYPGITQYLSRVYDKNNGQYSVCYKEGTPVNLRVIYSQAPITKEDALAKLKLVLPASAPESEKIDASEVTAGKKPEPVEYRTYGDSLKVELIYSDKSAKNVKLISVTNIGKASDGKSEGEATGKTAAADDKKTE
jgi:hypothetical protein